MRIFNEVGEKRYQEWVLNFCAKETKGQGAVPHHLLNYSDTSIELPGTSDPNVNYWRWHTPNKYDFITYLKPFIDSCLARVPQKMDIQRRVWDSFALLFFEFICPKDVRGNFNPNKFEHYMINDEGRSQRPVCYRHRIYGPYQFVACNDKAVKPFFEAASSYVGGDLEEGVGSRQEFVSNPVFLSLLARLYLNDGKPISGYTDKSVPIDKRHPSWGKKTKPGSLRRLMSVAMQLKNNYNFLQCTEEQMLELLGNEFSALVK